MRCLEIAESLISGPKAAGDENSVRRNSTACAPALSRREAIFVKPRLGGDTFPASIPFDRKSQVRGLPHSLKERYPTIMRC
jgi:hypothetical protein